MLEGTPVLVEVGLREHRAGVRMDADGDLWVAHWRAEAPERVAGTRLDGFRAAQIQGRDDGSPDWAAVGGRLPPGAVIAKVRDEDCLWCRAATGHGASAVFVDRSINGSNLPPVRFADARGTLVPARARERLRAAARLGEEHRRLLARTGAIGGGPCPVCGGTDWRTELVERPAMGQRIFCADCGHDDGGSRVFYSGTVPSSRSERP
jgi:hypothetical protein